jgi:sporulation protein YlmC with PRC-barrel domain
MNRNGCAVEDVYIASQQPENTAMKKLVAMTVSAVMLGGVALGQTPTQIMQSVPPQSVTVTDWYKQSVYDPSNNKIGEIDDVLLSSDGKVNALIVGVGGFLGIGEKHVAVPFSAVKHTTKDGKVYLTLDTTSEALKASPGFTYDRNSTSWVPDTSKR